MIPKQFLLILLVILPAILPAQIQHFTNTHYDFDGDGDKDFFRKDKMAGDNYSNYFSISEILTQNNGEIAFRENWDNWMLIADYLVFGDTISANLKWTSESVYINHERFNVTKEYNYNKDYFFAVRVKREDAYHYGWIRFRGGTDGGLRDAAVQLTPEKPIIAGHGIASIKPVFDDVFHQENNFSWSDYMVKFYPPFYEEYVAEYRLFISKANDSDEITVEKLAAIPESNYQKVMPGSKTFDIRLNDNLKDLDGEEIIQREQYKIVLLSMSNDTAIYTHDFNTTKPFIVKTKLPKTGTPLVLDSGDEGTSKDILLNFTSNNKEEFTESYRLMIVPEQEADTFNLQKAASVSPGNSYTIEPNEDVEYIVKETLLEDIYGSPVKQNTFYKSFIYAVPDSIQSSVGTLSEISNLFYLSNPDKFYAGQTKGSGTEAFFNATDERMQISYLDIEKDGEADLEMTAHVNAWWYKYDYDFKYWVHTIDSTEVLIDAEMSNRAQNNEVGDPIFESRDWGAGKILLTSGKSENGKINGTGNFSADYSSKGILGFRKISKNDTVYGWVNIHIYGDGTRFDEYAYQNRTIQSVKLIPDSFDQLFKTFPNPNSKRVLNIAIKDFKESEEYAVDILNHSGIKMKEFVMDKQQITINLKDLPRGLYYVRLRTPREQETQKIMVL